MPKKAASKDKREAPSSGGAKTDDEILRERNRNLAFATADSSLAALSWGLWVLAVFWFLLFNQAAPTDPDAESLFVMILQCMRDVTTVLVACGVFCGGIAKSSPKSTAPAWSWWRKGWHLGWGVALGLLALGFGKTWSVASAQIATPVQTAIAGPAAWLFGGCALAAGGMVLTCPSGPPSPVKGCSAPIGKVVLMLTGGLNIASLGYDFISMGGQTSANEPLGLVSLLVSALPRLMLATGAVCATAEAEVVAAVLSFMVVDVMVVLKLVVIKQSTVAASIPVFALLVKLCLFLPLPAKEPDANPFYMALTRSLRRWHRMMSAPVSGFGDSAEDG